MSDSSLPDDLVDRDESGTIVLMVLDGLGGLPNDQGRTELESAHTPNLDALARGASVGMFEPVGPGVTPGSGPAHLALFGYDPLEYAIGRGILSGLGVGFDLKAGDVAFRLNLASLDDQGRITDRRAGRPSDAEGRRIVAKVRDELDATRSRRFQLVPSRLKTPENRGIEQRIGGAPVTSLTPEMIRRTEY